MDEKQVQPTDTSTQGIGYAPKLKTIHAVGVVASIVLVVLAIILAGSLETRTGTPKKRMIVTTNA